MYQERRLDDLKSAYLPVYGVVRIEYQDALASYINENDAFRFLDEIEKLREFGEWPFAGN
jgi:hypothetical protein